MVDHWQTLLHDKLNPNFPLKQGMLRLEWIIICGCNSSKGFLAHTVLYEYICCICSNCKRTKKKREKENREVKRKTGIYCFINNLFFTEQFFFFNSKYVLFTYISIHTVGDPCMLYIFSSLFVLLNPSIFWREYDHIFSETIITWWALLYCVCAARRRYI